MCIFLSLQNRRMEYVSVNIVMLIVIIVSILLVEGYGGVMLIFLFIKGFVKC